MSLRIRVLLTVVLVLTLATLLDLGILNLIVFRSFTALERGAAQRDLARCAQAIIREVEHLNTFAQDWASWDDTYTFVQDRNRDYEAVNLLPEAFFSAQLNLLYVVDAAGQVVWGKAYDLETREELHLADFPVGAWPFTHPLLAVRPEGQPAPSAESLEVSEISGLLITERGLLTVAALPILTSAGEGPARGTLIMGRFLDRTMIEALRRQVGVDFFAWSIPPSDALPMAPDTVPADLRPALSQLAAQQPFFIQESSTDLLQIYTSLPGIAGQPALLLRADVPREITGIGRPVMDFVLLSILAVGVIVTSILLIFMRHVITGPLALLTAHALTIGKTGDLSARLALRRRDEIGVLAAEFDGMVAQLAQRTAELSRVNESLRQEITERKQTAETLVALHETALDLAGQQALPDLLRAIVVRAAGLLEAQGGSVYLYRPATDDLLLTLDYDLGVNYAGAILKRGEGLSGKVLETGRPLAVADYSHWEGRSAQYEGAGFAACVAVPIAWGERLLGVLNVLDDAPRAFSPTDIALLERFTPLAAAALEQTRLLEEERARWREAETLRQAGATITETLDPNERLERILEQLGRVVPYDSASIQLLQNDQLEIVGGRGFAEPAAIIGHKLPVPGDNPHTAIVVYRKPVIMADARAAYALFSQPTHDHIRSWLGAPLIVRDRVIGMLAVDSAKPAHFNEEHVRLVTPFANQVAVAIENARMFEATRRNAQELQITGEILRSLNATPDIVQAFPAIAAGLQALTGCQRASLALLDEKAEGFIMVALDRPRPELTVGATVPFAATACCADILAGRPHLTPDLAAELVFPGEQQLYRAGYRSRINLPLRAGDRILGALNLAWSQPAGYREANLALLGQIADAVALALERSRLFEESVRLHDEIRRHAADLERRVVERTAELSQREAALSETAARLQAANEQLKELDQLKSRFVANVSHELRTPLANIKTLLYLLEKGKLGKRPYYLKTLNSEADLLQQIIEDLLLLSRLDQGRTQPRLTPENINDLLETLATGRAPLFADRNLTLTTELAPGPLMVMADPRMLVQIATNLMTNAMHYTPPGGTVTVRTAKQLIGDETWVTFAIHDTGPGITPEDRAHLFERFYRGEAGRHSKATGAGLGLSICGELVERLGGKITVESEVGRGSAFIVWLPAREERDRR